MGHLFFLTISYILAVFFVILGVTCVIIPWSEPMRHALITFLQSNWITLFLGGIGFLAIGLALFINLSMSSRKRHYSLKIGPHTASIDATLVESYLKEYFTKRYPKREIPCRVSVKRETLQIAADLPDTPLEKQRELLQKVEKELQELLASTLGYKSSLRLFISFGE